MKSVGAAGVADTELYGKTDKTKPEGLAFPVLDKIWGQTAERGAIPIIKAAADPELTGRGFACETTCSALLSWHKIPAAGLCPTLCSANAC